MAIAHDPSFPPEIFSEIYNFCPPPTLASLARINTKFQFEVEQLLYSHIVVRHLDFSQVFATLTTSQRKAGYVNALTVEGDTRDEVDQELLYREFVRVLPKLGSLKDLRVRFLSSVEDWDDEFCEVLAKCHFYLHTLFCNDWLDFSQIMKYQTKLHLLGIYDGYQPPPLSTPNLLRSIILISSESPDHSKYNGLYVLPVLPPSRGDPQSLFRELQHAIDNDRASTWKVSSKAITEVAFFLNYVNDPDHLTENTKDMITYFPNVESVVFSAELSSELKLSDVKHIVSHIPNLSGLGFHADSETDDVTIDLSAKLRYAQEWNEVCRLLENISFFDGTVVSRNSKSTEWYKNGEGA